MRSGKCQSAGLLGDEQWDMPEKGSNCPRQGPKSELRSRPHETRDATRGFTMEQNVRRKFVLGRETSRFAT